MKPTKEQLADPKWWDENADSRDKYCYMDEKTGECFTTWHFDDGVHGFELLAKRPEPEWVPEVGVDCEYKYKNIEQEYKHGIPKFIGDKLIVIDSGFEQCYHIDSLEFRPKKTQREELINIIKYHEDSLAGCLADHIMSNYDLTEKDRGNWK